jgi:arginine N-succinyltransferase
MLRVRPVQINDHKEILDLATVAGIGMTSLPQDAEVLRDKIADSVLSFAGTPKKPKEEKFLLVLEDVENKKLVGTCGVAAHVGLSKPFYSYKLSLITQASQDLGIYTQQQVIHMVNDYTGASEIGSLFLDSAYRKNGNGLFLSRCRFLLIAEFSDLFSDIVIAEIRGVQDKNGHSAFYNNLAKHFFKMEFKDADYTHATRGGQFIADLMPKYPIYVNLLSPEAQDVIGVPLHASKPAMQMLINEGFSSEGYIDLFDAGPTVQAEKHRIRTVRKSIKAKVRAIEENIVSDDVMISNCRLKDFMVVRGKLSYNAGSGTVILQKDVAEALRIDTGESIRFAI